MVIPISGCVYRGSSALLCPGAYSAVKTALHVMFHEPYITALYLNHFYAVNYVDYSIRYFDR